MVSPILLAVLPIVPASEPIELALIGVSVAIGMITLLAGYREHRKARVLGLLALSLAFLGARFFVDERFETASVVTGAMLMAIAQFMNVRLQRHCCAHDHASRSELSSIASRV
jgi:hypothetical protein